MILEQMPTVDSLVNLVMASPDFYRCYKLAPSTAIYTATTLRELRARGIVFRTPTAYLEVRSRNRREASAILRIAVKILFEQLVEGKPILLDVEQCLALLRLEEVIRWGPQNTIEEIRQIRIIRDYLDHKILPDGRDRYSYIAIDKGLVSRQYEQYDASGGKVYAET